MECGSAQLGEVEEVLAESNSKEKGEGNGTDYRFACERRDLAHIYCAMLIASPPSFTPPQKKSHLSIYFLLGYN